MVHDKEKELHIQAAHEKIREGLYELLYARGDGGGVITAYSIALAQEDFDDDGKTTNWVAAIPSRDLPVFQSLGLLQSAVIRTEALIAGTRDVLRKLP